MQLPLFRLRLFALMWIHFAAAEDRMRVPLFPPAPFPMLAASYRGLFQRVGSWHNSAPAVYRLPTRLENLIEIFGYMHETRSISLQAIVDFSLLDELGHEAKRTRASIDPRRDHFAYHRTDF